MSGFTSNADTDDGRTVSTTGTFTTVAGAVEGGDDDTVDIDIVNTCCKGGDGGRNAA
jgi:hypothetical protein